MNNIQQTVVPLRIPAISPQMNTCQYNFLIAVLDQAFCFFQNSLQSSALDASPDVRDNAVGTVHIASILNLEECLCVSGKMAYLEIINGIFSSFENRFSTRKFLFTLLLPLPINAEEHCYPSRFPSPKRRDTVHRVP